MTPERERELVEVARLRLDGDWAGLIEWAEAHDCLPDRYGADRPAEYAWAGDHETDARHTYPNRARLVRSCLRVALGEPEEAGS